MTRRVLLHIGAPRSGTTYVQNQLSRNAASLAAIVIEAHRSSA